MRCHRSAVIALFFLLSGTCLAAEPTAIPLWQEGAPGTPATKPADEPTLYLWQPAADAPITKTAVIICPGGGYGHLAIDKEGHDFAKWFNSFGVTAFVLRYRHHGTGHMHPIPMQDGQRTVRTVRSRATEWNIDPDRIGAMGFSAGGHLASTLGTHFDAGDTAAADPIDRVSSRPDFLILCYPVITMTADYMHKGSRDNLIGKDADPELAQEHVERAASYTRNSADIYFPDRRRHDRARRKQRGILSCAPQSPRPCRVARLPIRKPRRRLRQKHSRHRRLVRPMQGMVAGPWFAPTGGKQKLRPNHNPTAT